MKTALLTSVAALFVLSAASFASAPAREAGFEAKSITSTDDMEAKRRKPRVPGGSGCNSAHDRAEHPECRVARHGADDPAGHVRGEGPGHASIHILNDLQQEARRRARVPGGSGCDSAHDRAEHKECRV